MQALRLVAALAGIAALFAAEHANAVSAQSGTGLTPNDLGIIVNDRDPLSRKIAEYYARARRIPAENIVRVTFTSGDSVMSRDDFERIKAVVDRRMPTRVQALALTWAAPYRVDCMSITTAFAAGFDPQFCAKGCGATRPSPYYDSSTRAPYSHLRWRPSMAIAARDFEHAKELIDRGVAADATFPSGTGYLVSTDDKARNIRAPIYPQMLDTLGKFIRLRKVNANYIEDRHDVMFYFTGAIQVPKLTTNRFVPGAIADHLTSTGGQLTDSTQMSSLRWLEAGATGSYGTVVEPCNHPKKFPNPGVLIWHYLQGDTLIEAYWRSVPWPGQGIFIGEPLAAPYKLRHP